MPEPADNPFRYAHVYYCYGSKEVDFDDDLGVLVAGAMWAEERGEQASGGYYELTADGWVDIDVSAQVAAFQDKEDAELAARHSRSEANPYRLYVLGPDGTEVWWSSHPTSDAAVTAARDLPVGLGWLVATGEIRPRANPSGVVARSGT